MLSRAGRVVKWLLVLVLGLACAAIVLVELIVRTPAGRELVRTRAMKLVSESLGAPFEIGRIESLSLSHLRARDLRLLTPEGREVASLAQLELELDPFALLSGRLHIVRVRLDRPSVDLGAPMGEGGGLLDLLREHADDKAPDTPSASSEAASRFTVQVDDLRIEGGRAVVVLQDEHWAVADLFVHARLEVGAATKARVEDARAILERAGTPVLTLSGTRLAYDSDGESKAQLELHAEDTRLTLRAVVGPELDADARSISAQLELQRFSAATLSALGLAEPPLREPLDLSSSIHGTPRELHARFDLATAGGKLGATVRWEPPSNVLEATLSTEHLAPSRFLDVALDPLAGVLWARAVPDGSFERVNLDAELRTGRYAELTLPQVLARGRYESGKGLHLHALTARYDDGARLEASGTLGVDRAFDLRAKLQVDSLAAIPLVRDAQSELTGSVTAELTTTGTAAGEVTATVFARAEELDHRGSRVRSIELDARAGMTSRDDLRVTAELGASELKVGRVHLPSVLVRLAGGPRRYLLEADLGSRGEARLTLDRDSVASIASGSAALDLGEGDFLRLQIAKLRHEERRGTELAGVQAHYRGAHALLHGFLASRGSSRLHAKLHAPDLAELARGWADVPISGALSVRASLAGRLRSPVLEVEGELAGSELAELRNATAVFRAHADLPAKLVEAKVELQSEAATATADLRSKLARSVLDRAAFERGEHELSVSIERLSLLALPQLHRAELAMSAAELTGRIDLTGTLAEPALRGELRARLHFEQDPAPILLTLAGAYGREELRLRIEAEGPSGVFLRSQVDTELAGSKRRSRLELASLLTEHGWDASLWLGARRIGELPAVRGLGVNEELFPARVSGQARISHRPGREPDGELELRALWPAPTEHELGEGCDLVAAPELIASATLGEGELAATARASVRGRKVIELASSLRVPIGRWLVAQKTQPVSVSALVHALELSELPVICKLGSGRLSGRAQLARALTEQVTASVDLRGERLRWGAAPETDVQLSAHADDDALVLRAELRAGQGSALLAGKIPIERSGRVPGVGLDAPVDLQVQLSELDVRTLLAPVSAVSARGGQLDGRLHVSGSLRAPLVRGEIELKEVTLVLPAIGQPLERVNGKLVLDGRRLSLSRTRIHDRDGWVEVSGELELAALDRWTARMKLRADDFPVRHSGVVLAEIDARAKVGARAEAQRTQLDVVVDDASVELTGRDIGNLQSLDPNPDIVFVDQGEAAHDAGVEQALAPDEQRALTVVDIDATQPFWIRRSDFSVQLMAKLRVELREAGPSVSGQVDLLRGYVELLGQTFDVERGGIAFAGGQEVVPTLDLVLSRRAPGGTRVRIEARGTIREPDLAFFVDDEAVTAGEAIAAATGSRSADEGGFSVRDQVGSVATGIATGALTLGARRELGDFMPVIAFEQGDGDTRLRAGIGAQRLVPKFLRSLVIDAYIEGMLGTEQRAGSTSQSDATGTQTAAAVLLELRFPHDLVGEIQYGPGARWSIDLGWEP